MTESRTDVATDAGLVLLAMIWGVNFSVMKVVLRELDPLAVNALRFPLAAIALALVLRSAPVRTLPSRADIPRIVLLGILGHVGYQLCFIFGLDWTRAGNASLLLSTTPIWTVILSGVAGHERPTRWVLVGVLGTLVGMVLVVLGRGDVVSLSSETVRGDLLMVVASILWSIYTVAGRGPVGRYGPLRMTVWTVWIGAPIIVGLGLPSLLQVDVGSISPTVWAGVAYSGFLSIGLAYLLWYRGVQRLGNNRTAIYSNLVPVAALLVAWLWLAEVPTPAQLLGAAVILAGLTIARLAQSPGPSSRR